MMNHRTLGKNLAIAAASLFGFAALASADLSEVKFGEHISGPEISESDFEGHVVALEIWGTA